MDITNHTSSSSPTYAPTSGTALTKSPSDLSYSSSGASPSLSSSHHTSRHTSPDSVTVTHSSSPSQQSALVDITSTVDLHCNPSLSLSKNQHKMDRNPFQSVNERRNKLASDHNSGASSQVQQQQQTQQSPSQPHFPSQALRSNMQQQQLTLPSRGLASSNWRSQGADDQAYASSSRGSSGEYASPFDSIPPPLSLSVNAHPTTILRQQSQQAAAYLSPHAEHFPQHQLDFMSGPTNHSGGAGMGAGTCTGTGMNAGMGAGAGAVEGATASPTGTHFPNLQMDGIYAYCFDRGNGQYTRLIPADVLPPLKDVPALQQGCAGMMVLPLPRGLPQSGRSSNTDIVTLKTPPHTPTGHSDTIQSRIDTIVASTPPTPPHHQHTLSGGGGGFGTGSAALTTTGAGPGSGGSGGQGSHGHAHSYSLSQAFDNHHNNSNNSNNANNGNASNGNGNNNGNGSHSGRNASGSHGGGGGSGGSGAGGQQPQQRRPKVYCDKWVHEGVCAFTQQGCKYKHEMPFDKVTQHALGLFHGFPAWWKKHQADLSRQRDGPGPQVPSSLVVGANAGGGGGGAGMSGLGITVGAGPPAMAGMGTGGDGTQELTGLSASRFMGRAGAGAGSGPSSAGVGAGIGFIEGKGDGAGMASSPTTPGLPSWRRGGEHHSSEQKPLGTGRGMTRGVASGMRNPIVSYGSPFGPIAPPPRTFSTGPSATANPYSTLESLDESNIGADNGEEEVAGETSRSSGARLS